MVVPTKYFEIKAKFQKALSTEDFSEIDSIPLQDLKLAKSHLIKDINSPYYSLLLEKINEKESQVFQADDKKDPLVFISYDTRDIELAHAIDDLLQRFFGGKVKTFIARRDIKAGDDAFKTMLHENLAK